MKIKKTEVTKSETRRYELEDGPIVDAANYRTETKMMVSNVTMIYVDGILSRTFVAGRLIKKDGTVGVSKRDFWIYGGHRPQWLIDILKEENND